jgi:hypothetical protein
MGGKGPDRCMAQKLQNGSANLPTHEHGEAEMKKSLPALAAVMAPSALPSLSFAEDALSFKHAL